LELVIAIIFWHLSLHKCDNIINICANVREGALGFMETTFEILVLMKFSKTDNMILI